MKKMSLDALREKAGSLASNELLNTISGGLENGCHVTTQQNPDGTVDIHIYKG
jgi:hypothetical protein